MDSTSFTATGNDQLNSSYNLSINNEKPLGDLSIDVFIILNTPEPNHTCINFTTWYFAAGNCQFFFSVFLTTFLCLVGFIGNSFTIAVLQRDRDPHRQRSTNWLLEALAVADIVFLAFSFIFVPLRTIAIRSEALATVRDIFPYMIQYLLPFASISHVMTIWIVVLVTVDRYLAICKPLHPEWRSMRRAKIAVAVLFILAIIYNIPRFCELDVEMMEDCENGDLRPHLALRTFAMTVYYQYIYEAGCDFVFRSVGPLVILVVLNVRISWAIRELNKKRREMTLEAKEEKTLTVMLIIVVIVFVVCQLPFTGLSIAFPTAVFYPVTVNWKAVACAFEIANALNVLNSSVNFLVYCLIWRKFGRILVRMMACKEENANGQI